MGLSLGKSIFLSSVFLGIIGGIGWLLLSRKIGIGIIGTQYIAILLSIQSGLTIHSLGR